MRQIKITILITGFLIFISLLITNRVFSQESDYCFRAKSNWGALHDAACFDASLPLEIGKTAAQVFQKNYKPFMLEIKGENELHNFENGYHLMQFDNYKGAQRVVIDFSENMRLVFAYLPYNKDFSEVQIVGLLKTNGESQLIFDKIVKKVKVETGTNESAYLIEFTTDNYILSNEKVVNTKVIIILSSGTDLKTFTFGPYYFTIPKN